MSGLCSGGERGAMRRLAKGGLIAAWIVLTVGAAAAEEEVEKGRKLFDGKAGCSFCHGWAGDGQGDPRSEGGAPSLRVTERTRDQIREVIQCGRPATSMPYHDRFAYTDDRCYGMTAADLGDDMPKRSVNTLQGHEIDAVADYVAANIAGAGPVTFEQCVQFFGEGARACANYPKADGSPPAAAGAAPEPAAKPDAAH